MESLAALVVTIILAMFVSALVAVLLAWRGRTFGLRVVALVVGLPGGILGALLFVNAGSTGGRIIGAIGIAACLFAGWRMARLMPQALRDES